jgi:hypothetical protein
MPDWIADQAPLPFIAVTVVILLGVAGLDADHPSRAAAMSSRDVLLLAALHFALAACILIAAISLGNAA